MTDEAPQYPLPRTADDPRFTFGLIWDVAKVLEQYGYPPVLTGDDHVRLQQALFGFIYESGADRTGDQPK